MSEDMEVKITAFGKFKAGLTAREVSEELDVPYSKALKWKNQLREAENNGEVSSLVDVDELLIHRIAEDTKQDLVALGADVDVVEGELETTIDKIDSYKLLSDKMNTTAIKLVDKISGMASLSLEAKELNLLVESLAKLQEAFFNKQQTNINILNQTSEVSNTSVSKFGSLGGRD